MLFKSIHLVRMFRHLYTKTSHTNNSHSVVKLTVNDMLLLSTETSLGLDINVVSSMAVKRCFVKAQVFRISVQPHIDQKTAHKNLVK